ncbi:MAG: transcription antitermination factor NusB [Treponema sp.]|nr:transcription antitermination factor NusB [Treponema sp.]
MSRRKGRVLAFQALYSYDVGGIPMEDLLQFSWTNADNGYLNKDEYIFARLLVSGTLENIDEIDSAIKRHLSANWDFSRISRVSLAILRMSVYSVLFQKDIDLSIVIDEAIQIAKEFDNDDSFRFINAVLDKIAGEI